MSRLLKMESYRVKVYTWNAMSNAVKWLSVRLEGKDGISCWTWFSGARTLLSDGRATFTMTCPKSLGELEVVNLRKTQLPLTLESQWFVEKVEVTSPDGKVFKFPVYHWLKRTKEYGFCEGKALRAHEENSLISHARMIELGRRAQKYRWKVYKEGLPYCMIGDSIFGLPSEVQFSITKLTDFGIAALPQVKTRFFNLFNWQDSWNDFGEIEQALAKHLRTPASEYVKQHWREDAFFGYQFLNGVNPAKIRRCTSLPSNFPVTDDMVTLEGKGTLSDEMKNGNIFFYDYKNLDGVETGTADGKKKYLMAPLVLFHKTPAGELKPIAIQLKQMPHEDNPIFLPTDSENDWLLAKTYVRGAEFAEHQLNSHLLRTHLLAEVFAVSLLKNLPKVHPVYKLLVPHTRYTLQINLLARQLLISETGLFPTFSASTANGMTTILQRSLSALTYTSLCIKEDVKERGMESFTNYYYMNDGFELWDIIEKFVKGVVTNYYKSDEEIKEDHELENYIKDIFKRGFLSNEASGIPQSFKSVKELVQFATMVIFTSSAQHAAVNNGQSDFGSWMPNVPTTLMQAPPTAKGEATEQTLLQTLPGRNISGIAVEVLRLLSKPSNDFVPLGHFPQENFTEDEPVKLMNIFAEELKKLDERIDLRNEKLDLPYIYLKPKLMENSVSI